ncbi:MAG: alkaline phosphatase family protein [Cyclobacteriaceae bacterium]
MISPKITKPSLSAFSFPLLAFRFAIVFLLPAFITSAQQPDRRARTLIVIFDGLRPDYITPENMPNVHALKKTGAYGQHNHSVFPTVTRVNASSYITGSYPAKHGLMGNTVYFPEVDKTHGLNTGEFADLRRIAEATHDKLLTSVSLGELLQQAGEKMMVFSSGSSGQAFLQNHTVSGGVVHPELILPASLKEDVIKTMGNPPSSAKPNTAQHEWVTRAMLHYALAADGPAVSAIWLSDPDGTAHSEGIGAPLTMESIKIVDQQFGNIIQALKEKNLINSFNIIITADHGFATDVGTEGITKFLIAKGLKKESNSEDVVVAGNALYVKDRDPVLIKKIVSTLQEQPCIGAIFTKSAPGQSTKGWVEGTLSFESIHWDHDTRAADILVDYNWDNRKNTYGYQGASFAIGVAGHGGSSPYEIHIPLIASGPAFKKAYESSIPTSNTDIVPTILRLHGLNIPSEMDGRVLNELLSGTSQKQKRVKKEILETKVKHSWGTYELILERSIVGKQQYVDHTHVKRNFNTNRK